MADEVEAIIEAIRSAFAGVQRRGITIHEAEVMDVYGSDVERQRARRLDTEESWERVPDGDIEECTTALSHLDPEGWRYYLPAYMIWSIRYFGRGSIVPDHTIYSLALAGSDSGLREYQMDRFRLLNHAQSRAICRFLRHMAASDDYVDGQVANLALDELWSQIGESTDGS